MIEIAVVPDTFKPLDKGNTSIPIQCILTVCDLLLSLYYVIFITRIWNRYSILLLNYLLHILFPSSTFFICDNNNSNYYYYYYYHHQEWFGYSF